MLSTIREYLEYDFPTITAIFRAWYQETFGAGALDSVEEDAAQCSTEPSLGLTEPPLDRARSRRKSCNYGLAMDHAAAPCAEARDRSNDGGNTASTVLPLTGRQIDSLEVPTPAGNHSAARNRLGDFTSTAALTGGNVSVKVLCNNNSN